MNQQSKLIFFLPYSYRSMNHSLLTTTYFYPVCKEYWAVEAAFTPLPSSCLHEKLGLGQWAVPCYSSGDVEQNMLRKIASRNNNQGFSKYVVFLPAGGTYTSMIPNKKNSEGAT